MKKQSKILMLMVLAVAILVVIVSSIIIFIINNYNNMQNNFENEEIAEEVILDECTDEYENMEDEIIETNSKNEKISPNCKIVLRKYYKKCKHEINEYVLVPEELVNCTKEEFQKKYKGWELKEFSSNQIILYKEFDELCGQHYILKNAEGKINIYKINEKNEEILYEKTDISIDYLPMKDKKAIENGLKINGKERLNSIIESFE